MPTRNAAVYLITLPNEPSSYIAENNIVAFNDTGVDWYGTAPEWKHNDVFGNGQDYPKDGPDLTGQGGNIAVAPLFVDAANGDYHLLPLSACLDAGDDLATQGAYDLDGAFRIQGAHVDMGAYEAPVSAMRTMADVARALRIAAGLATATPSDAARLHAYDGGQNVVTIADAAHLARKVAGLEPNP
jgi:hypothetical protein